MYINSESKFVGLIIIPQDSEFLVVAAAGSPRIFRSLASDSFVVQRSTLLAQNLLPKIPIKIEILTIQSSLIVSIHVCIQINECLI